MTDSLERNEEVNEEINEIVQINQSTHEITDLQPKMQRFIHLYITGQYTLAGLAELLEVHPNTLGKWLKREDVKEIISDLQIQTHDMVGVRLKSLSLSATEKLSKLVNSPIDGVAMQAVKDILDRTGHKPRQEIKVDKTVVTYEERLKDIINNTIDVTDYEVMDDE